MSIASKFKRGLFSAKNVVLGALALSFGLSGTSFAQSASFRTLTPTAEIGESLKLEVSVTPAAGGSANWLTAGSFTLDVNSVMPGLSGFTTTDSTCSGVAVVEGATITVSHGFVIGTCTMVFSATVPAGTSDADYTFSPGDLTSTRLGGGNVVLPLGTATVRVGDNVSPTTTLAGPGGTVSAPFTVTLQFTDGDNALGDLDPVTGVSIGDFSITNGTITSLLGGEEGAASSYRIDVSPTGATPIEITYPAGAALDRAGNGNLVSNSLSIPYAVEQDFVDFAASFLDSPVAPGGATTLRYTITNNHPTETMTAGEFDHDLDGALSGLAAGTPLPSPACGTGSSVSFSGGILDAASFNLAAGGSCQVDIPIVVPGGATGGSYAVPSTNMTYVLGALGAVNDDTDIVSPSLDIAGGEGTGSISLTKSFADDPVAPGGTVTVEYTITAAGSFTSTDLAFTDNLNSALSGLVAVGLPSSNVCGAGSTLSGTSTISLTSGSLAQDASCTFSVTLQAPGGAATGDYTSTTSTLSATRSDVGAVTSPSASDTLSVVAPAPVIPTTTISGPAGTVGLGVPFQVTVRFSEGVTGFVLGDVAVTNGTPSNFQALSAVEYTVDVTPTAAGNVDVNVGAGAAKDADDNDNTAATTFTVSAIVGTPEIAISGNGTEIASGDATPDAADHTNFGTAEVAGGTIVRTFTISNSGSGSLAVASAALSGANSGDFSVTSTSAAIVAPGGSTTFQVTFDPSAIGTRNAIVTVTNDDGDEGSYVFSISGEGGATPEINITNAAQTLNILDGDASPTAADGTDFGNVNVSGASPTATFVVQNTGNADLTLDATPVSISGSGAFTITSQPSGPIAAAGSSSFTIQFDPSVSGAQNATVTVGSDDSDENPYIFGLTGFGVDNEAPAGYSVAFDAAAYGAATNTAASITIDDPEIGATYNYTITSSGGGTAVTGSGTIPIPAAGTPSEYQVSGIDISGLGDGTLTVAVSLTDTDSNVGGLVNNTATHDTTAPTPVLSTGSSDPVSGAFTLTVAFGEAMTGFALGDLSVSNGVASGLTDAGGGSYTVTITPSADGAVTVDVVAAAAQDVGGNNNNAATQFSITNDETAPTVAITSGASDPTSGAFSVTVTFSEVVSGFVLGDITVGNGAASNLATSDNRVFTADITPAADGAVTVDVAASVAQDAAGNNNTAATQFSLTNDQTAPTVTITSGSSDPTSGVFSVTVTFTEVVSGFVLGDITVGNGAASNLATADNRVFTADITPAADGAVTVDVAASVTQDAAGNNNTAATQFSLTNDQTAPTVTITSGSSDPTSGVFSVTVTFSEVVSGFVLGDITVGNGAASNLATADNRVFTADITPAADGAVTVDVAASVAQDAAGNNNTAATQFSLTNDQTAPTVAITSASSDPVSGAFSVTVTFSEVVSGFVVGDLTVGNGAASNLATPDNRVFTATITPAGDGEVSVDVAAAVAQDAAGNGNTSATQFTITNDETLPGVTITSASGDPVSGGFSVTVTFSEVVSGFAIGDITVGNGTASNLATGDNQVYTATITPAGDGQVSVDVAGAVAQDAAGNDNTSAIQFTITNDETRPSVVVSSISSDPVSGGFPITITFDEPVSGFSLGDIVVSNGNAGILSTSDNTVFTASVRPDSGGLVTIDIAAGVAQDAAGNDNTAAAQFSITNDQTPPSVVISSTSSDPVSGVFAVTFAFDENVTGFTVGDITVGNGAASNFAGSNAVYTADITPASDGTVTVDVAAGVAQDAAGNDNTSAAQFTIENDETGPTVTSLVVSDADVRNDDVGNAFTVTVDFSEPVDTSSNPALGFTPDASTALSFQSGAFSNTDMTYTATYTVLDSQSSFVDVDVTVSSVADVLGNALIDSTTADLFSVEQRRGGITIAATVNGLVDGSFDFTGDLGSFIVTTAGQSGNRDFADLAEGIYSIAFTEEDGFSLDTLTCVGGSTVSDAGAGTLDVTLAPTDAVTCTFALTADPEVDETQIPNVSITLASETDDPATSTTTFDLTNTGGSAFFFEASTDAAWLTIDPTSGSIPASGSLTFTVSFTTAVLDLAPGTYNATITVTEVVPAPQKDGLARANTLNTINIPVSITLEPREGTLTLVSTTLPDIAGQGSFSYSSDLAEFNGVTLTTVNGTASTSVATVLRGSYDITQAAAEGWRLSAITCTGDDDSGSTFDLVSGTATIDLDPEEEMTCTFANVRDEDYIREITTSAIRSFMAARADQILTNSPNLSRRMRTGDGVATQNRFAAEMTDRGFEANFSTSLNAMRMAARDDRAPVGNDQQLGAQNSTGMGSLDVWVEATFSSVSDNRAGLDAESDFGLWSIGTDFLQNENLLVGAMIQFDSAETVTGEWRSRVEGDGWLAGPYMVARVSENMYFDMRGAWGRSENEVNPIGTYWDDFDTTRWLFETNLTGDFEAGGWRISPAFGVAYFSEEQAAYTDSLGIYIPSQEITIGRANFGPEFAYRIERSQGGFIEPFVRLNAIWDYDSVEVINASGILQGVGDFRADARLGLNAEFANGGILSAEVGLQGVGETDFEANSAMLRVRLPLSMH